MSYDTDFFNNDINIIFCFEKQMKSDDIEHADNYKM